LVNPLELTFYRFQSSRRLQWESCCCSDNGHEQDWLQWGFSGREENTSNSHWFINRPIAWC